MRNQREYYKTTLLVAMGKSKVTPLWSIKILQKFQINIVSRSNQKKRSKKIVKYGSNSSQLAHMLRVTEKYWQFKAA